jgi:hypothetical protein
VRNIGNRSLKEVKLLGLRPIRSDTHLRVAKVVLPKVSKILRAAGAFFV